jgi:hypothetical protein
LVCHQGIADSGRHTSEIPSGPEEIENFRAGGREIFADKEYLHQISLEVILFVLPRELCSYTRTKIKTLPVKQYSFLH